MYRPALVLQVYFQNFSVLVFPSEKQGQGGSTLIKTLESVWML